MSAIWTLYIILVLVSNEKDVHTEFKQNDKNQFGSFWQTVFFCFFFWFETCLHWIIIFGESMVWLILVLFFVQNIFSEFSKKKKKSIYQMACKQEMVSNENFQEKSKSNRHQNWSKFIFMIFLKELRSQYFILLSIVSVEWTTFSFVLLAQCIDTFTFILRIGLCLDCR